jgi:hypothetical protein
MIGDGRRRREDGLLVTLFRDERWKQVLSDTSSVAAVSKKLKVGS